MASITTRMPLSELLTRGAFFEEIQRCVETVKALTIYQSPYTGDTLLRWEISEFDPYFVHEDF